MSAAEATPLSAQRPHLRLERAEAGDLYLAFDGERFLVRAWSDEIWNVRDNKNLVASMMVSRERSSALLDDETRCGPYLHPDTGGELLILDQIWVEYAYRGSGALQILVTKLRSYRLPVYAAWSNHRLMRHFEREHARGAELYRYGRLIAAAERG
jgi:hypothetical protein